MGCIYFYGILGVIVPVIVYATYVFITEELKRRKLARWENTPKDEVILHCYPRGLTIPSPSPYPCKVETYMRLCGIKYTHEPNDIFGPKGKTPWISFNGTHLGDSEFIIEFLNKKFEKNLNQNHDEVTVANARIIRVMLEEYFVWAIGLERMVYGSLDKFKKVVGSKIPTLLLLYFKRMVKRRAYDQGIGRHTQAEVEHLMSQCLKSVSLSLGSKRFFGGDELCQEDCGIFGILSQCLWAAPESPYETLMNTECKNLKDYCLRIKEKVYPDWDQLLRKE